MFDAEKLRRELLTLQDESYRDFQAKNVPTVAKEKFIGIRTPVLTRFVRRYFSGGAQNSSASSQTSSREDSSQASLREDFLSDLPHKYFEENSIHALLISEMKDFDECLTATKTFLPYVDNWATCDSITPKIFAQHTDELEAEILTWLKSERTYTVRFALCMLMKFYLDENFSVKYLERAAAVQSREYYVEMATAWFFATALAKHFDATTEFLTQGKLTPQIRRRTLRKALESRRLTAEQKAFLRGLPA